MVTCPSCHHEYCLTHRYGTLVIFERKRRCDRLPPPADLSQIMHVWVRHELLRLLPLAQVISPPSSRVLLVLLLGRSGQQRHLQPRNWLPRNPYPRKHHELNPWQHQSHMIERSWRGLLVRLVCMFVCWFVLPDLLSSFPPPPDSGKKGSARLHKNRLRHLQCHLQEI